MHYTSRAVSVAEYNYPAFEREALGVTFALKKFRLYLTSNRFTLYTDNQELKYAFNMRDIHGRIARWITQLAEYEFEVCYRAERNNACPDFLSRLVELMVIDENQPFEANIKAITHSLDTLAVVEGSISIMLEFKKKAKEFLAHDKRMFRRTKYRIRFIPRLEMRESILKGLHDKFGHWDFNSTYSFVSDRF